MKTLLKTLTLLAIISFSISACKKYSQKRVYTANIPIYLSYDALRDAVKNENDLSLSKPGKIFLYGNYILINDFEKGVHIYDNSNPSNPEHVAFISIPGNVDMAVKDNILYADSYVDIVAVDITNPGNAKVVGRAVNTLSYTIPSGLDYHYPVATVDQSKGVVVGYSVGEVEEQCENSECGYVFYDNVAIEQGTWGGSMMSADGSPVSFAGSTSNNVRSMSASNNTAIAGSMARFMMIDSYLYAISDQSTVKVFEVNQGSIKLTNEFSPSNNSWNAGNIETLFALKENLFIGSSAGMLIYNISDPSTPTYLSDYSHMTSCDPVVATSDYAFVTLRAGNTCGSAAQDELDVLDISDIMNPFEVDIYPMSNPRGLSIDANSLLFVCDAGLKIYDATNAENLVILNTADGETYDVITHNNIAHVIGNNGLEQYQYDTKGNLVHLSTISLN